MSQIPSKEFYKSEEWKLLKTAALARDLWICQYCGGKAQTADHRQPRSKGGEDTLDNLIASCHECNEAVSNREFKNFSHKHAWLQAFAPMRKKRKDGREKLKREIQQLQWDKASLTITAEERRQIKRRLIKAGYVLNFTNKPFWCRHCSASSTNGSGWTSHTECPACHRDLKKELNITTRPFTPEAAVVLKRNELLANPNNYLCSKCDSISENSQDCKRCDIPF